MFQRIFDFVQSFFDSIFNDSFLTQLTTPEEEQGDSIDSYLVDSSF
jgi:hypothetical protein